MLKLYAVFLGGRAKGCNIEAHDVVFAVGKNLKSIYPQLKLKWFGLPRNLHIDAYCELTQVDGYHLSLTTEKIKSKLKLYFVNFGGSKPGYFGEIHENKFYVGTSKQEVLLRAKSTLCSGEEGRHCDDNLIVEKLIGIKGIDGYYLQFIPGDLKEVRVITTYIQLF